MAKAFPSDDEVEAIGVIGHCASKGTRLKQGSYTLYNRSLKATDDAIRYGDIPPSQMGGREKENDTFRRSRVTSDGDKEQRKYDNISCSKTPFIVRENDTISLRKTALMQSQHIKNSDSDISQRCYIPREESQRRITRADKDRFKGVKADASLDKWPKNKTKDVERQKRISNDGNDKLQGDTTFGIRRQQSSGSLHRDIKTERNLNPKKDFSNVRKQCKTSVESVRKMKNINASNICDVTARSKQRGIMDDERSSQKQHISIGRSLNSKTKHGHAIQKCDFSNRLGHAMKTGHDINNGEGSKLAKKHYGWLHGDVSSETFGTLVTKNNEDHGTHDDIDMSCEKVQTKIQNPKEIISKIVEEIDHTCSSAYTMSPQSTICATATVPPKDFRELSIWPSLDDIQTNVNPFLRAIRSTGSYESLDLYLDTHFRLLREDFMNPLRKGISEYTQTRNKNIKEIKIYNNVEIVCPTFANEGINHLIKFDVSALKRMDWAVCRRFIYGSLVCLSCDNFRTIYYATAANRNVNDLHNGLVEVNFENVPITNRSTRFLMAESTTYFEAFRHVLTGLQSVDSSLPFQRYIIDCNPTIKPPSYLQSIGVPVYDFTCILPDKQGKKTIHNIPALNTARWPTPEDLSLDRSQYEALQLALTKELAIIQGPPGTGKTYIGLQITKMLIENKSYWKDSKTGAPILVVCYTNHALDQFLEGISRFCDGRIARIGGRCNNAALQPYTLSNLKKEHRLNKSKSQKRDHYFKTNPVRQIKMKCVNKVKVVTSELKKTFTEIQPYNILKEHMTPQQRKAFAINSTDTNLLIIEWLKIEPSPLMQTKHLSKNKCAKMLWIAHILKDVEQMSKTDKNRVSDVSEIDLLRRAQLYKSWLEEVQTRVRVLKYSQPESKSNMDSISQKSQQMIIYPVDMLPYVRSQQTKFQLKCFGKEVDFEVWLAVDGSSTSTDAIFHIYNKIIHDSENEVEEIDQPGSESDLLGNIGDFKETRDWILNWNARYEHANLTVVATGIRELYNEEALRMVNIWSLPDKDRRSLYWHWVCKHRDVLKSEIEKTEQQYKETAGVLTEFRDEETIEILCKKDVIGMTTTGAAKNRKLLQSIKPAILIVEEAAEVLESHIITALNANCKHLILIGDHKQLRPSTTVYHLAQKYHLDISLFERMVLNDIPCVTLSEQHRMRPEISVLLKNEYLYPELRDHKAVSEYEHIRGVDSDVFFIDHSEKEANIPDSTSYQNLHEAKFTLRLCNYLLKQGYEKSQVTILTPYMGQVTLLRKEMRKFKMDGIHVTAVDNFQGEENDIILLSLVRSNTPFKRKNAIGFLAIANRVCVALSRAKKGFYVIGNFAIMQEYSRLWRHNVNLMEQTKRIGQEITLRCQNHPKTIIKASKCDDFDNAPEGGCTEPCLTTLKCSHVCPKICHIIDRDHENAKCMEACTLSLPKCGHKCKKICFKECEPCKTQMEKEVPFCGHRAFMPCPLDPDDWACKIKCEFQLQCGHSCSRMCDCCKTENGHERLCKARVAKELACGHTQKLHCYQDPDNVYCTELYCVSLPCGHEAEIACGFKSKVLNKYKCEKHVSKQLQCGHILELQCFKDPSAVVCVESFSVTLLCGHTTALQCSQNPRDVICSKACGVKLLCGHICTGTCGTCFGGKIHQPCVKQCQRIRLCGHTCKHRCGEKCPPCNLPCEWICSHGIKCKKKCSERCDPCRRKCNYGCIHSRCTKLCYEFCDYTQCNNPCTKKLKCGHTCVGLCGELCVCSKFSCIKKKTIYERSDRGTTFIKLPKCGCIIPQNVLDEYMSTPSDVNDGILKRCMLCRQFMSSRIQRYSNTIKISWNAAFHESRAIEVSERLSNTHIYKASLFRRVHRLSDIGLEEYNVNILKDRLRDITFDARHVIEKTVDLLEQLLRVSQNLPAEAETDLAIKPNELTKLILKERNDYTAQLWEEIRNEIKQMDGYLRHKNLQQEAIEDYSDYDTESLSDNDDSTLYL